ncbi:YceI family protein [Hymenobacter sp. 5516J-16]|uniref:YceI family protein n=1 Tax=Hymenobacter sublimis TaxID=2933777 RepID=A0ABY4J6I4_9BACT|nr:MULTISPECIES: YceI family protein [Hymenobacter]UOQ78468.1 YceI family protein [Hymenobacter sp. 5516J-16]UPL48440.1 YceI family protein [Hymenobacter sublimis]
MLLVGGITTSQAQGKYMTQKGVVSFFSSSILEDIEAHTDQAAAVVDLQSQQIAFIIPIKSFQFKRTLMQEHFNENYMESDRLPKSTFKGKILDLNADALAKGQSQRVTVEGDLTIHGVTKHLTVAGALEQQKGTLLVNAYFSVAPADYGIEVPLLVRENIAKIVGIKVVLTCEAVSQLTVK